MTWNWENSLKKLNQLQEQPNDNVTDSDDPSSYWWSTCKKLHAKALFVIFFTAFDFIHTGEMEHILLPCSLLKETIRAIKFYKCKKEMVRSTHGDTNFFNIVAGVKQRNTLEPNLLNFCLDYELRTSVDLIKEIGFTSKKTRRYDIP